VLTVSYGEQTVKLAVGSNDIDVNGTVTKTDVAPVIINERTMLPVRALAENLGLSVSWKAETQESVFSNELQTMRIVAKHDGTVDFGGLGASTQVSGPDNIEVLQFQTREAAAAALQKLQKTGGIIYAEPDAYIPPRKEVSEASPDAASHLSWGAATLNVDAYANYLKSSGKQGNVLVAVVDTGVDPGHSHLAGRIAGGGYDFAYNDPDPKDGDGHGTHVSGTIVDCTPGLSNIKILPVKVLNDDGQGTFLAISNGIRYAADKSAKVINMSLGGPGNQPIINDAVKYAISRNSTVVVSAGNDSIDANLKSPSNISDCIVVAAFDSNDKPASFTNFGATVDVAAPGVKIKSSIPNNGYDSWNGTSMAAPHISALAAMYVANDPSLNPAAVEALLKKNTRVPAGYNLSRFGAGIPDMAKAIDEKPQNPVATPKPTATPQPKATATPSPNPTATPTTPAPTDEPKGILRSIKSIVVAELPKKLKYLAGELLDAAGLKLKITYDNGEEEIIDFSPSEFTLSLERATGFKLQIKVTHKESGQSTTFNIND
jgi:subtilisin family serine protease